MEERHYKNEGIHILNSFKEKKNNKHCHSDKIKNELISLTKNITVSELKEILNSIKCTLTK